DRPRRRVHHTHTRRARARTRTRGAASRAHPRALLGGVLARDLGARARAGRGQRRAVGPLDALRGREGEDGEGRRITAAIGVLALEQLRPKAGAAVDELLHGLLALELVVA